MKYKMIEDLDYNKYKEIFELCYPGQTIDKNKFNWHFRDCPRKSYIMEDNDTIASILSVLRHKVRYNDKDVYSSLVTNAMTNPNYRGQRLYSKLERNAIHDETTKGIDFLYLVPNDNIIRSHYFAGFRVRYNLDFIGMYDFEKESHDCTLLSKFGKELDDYQKDIYENTKFSIYKDADYLNWRYTKRPDKDYTIYGTYNDEDELTGWTVLSKFNDNGYRKAHIVEISAKNFNSFYNLIHSAINYSIGSHELNTWLVDNSIYSNWYNDMGFFPLNKKNVIMLYNEEKLTQKDFNFTLGDNDVY